MPVPGMIEAAKKHNCPVMLFATSENRKDQTVWLEMAYPEDKVPTEMLAELQAAGWGENGMLLKPLIHFGIVEKSISAKGSGLFGGFVGKEKAAALRKCRSIIRKYGYTGVGTYVMTMADMM
ncbi:hypothetical protein vBRpoSV10_136 [Ruegeria phage vB_RpoS-V10]|nr:hypothetical protein vBRpoSV10_136 [Ruegeria phage vB_RpoS-V10]